jgi:hypothetical protein
MSWMIQLLIEFELGFKLLIFFNQIRYNILIISLKYF